MASSAIPGVVVNTSRKKRRGSRCSPHGRAETASRLLGGQEALAAALGVNARLLRAKISAERPISDTDVLLTVAALTAQACRTAELADRLQSIVEAGGSR